MVYTVVAERTGVLKRLEEKKKEKEFINKGVEKYFSYISWWSSPLGQNRKHAVFILEHHSWPRPGRGHRKETGTGGGRGSWKKARVLRVGYIVRFRNNKLNKD